MKAPVEGMTVNPVGQDYMFDAWFACVLFVGTQDAARAAFTEETGFSLDAIIRARGIDAMIDKATGHDKKVLSAFCDWVTVNHWGVEK